MQVLTHPLARLLTLGALLVMPLTAVYAVNVDQAKSQGLVCELPTGYLKPTGQANAEVRAMVADINEKRKAQYTKIANENGVKPEEVGILTARKLEPKCP